MSPYCSCVAPTCTALIETWTRVKGGISSSGKTLPPPLPSPGRATTGSYIQAMTLKRSVVPTDRSQYTSSQRSPFSMLFAPCWNEKTLAVPTTSS